MLISLVLRTRSLGSYTKVAIPWLKAVVKSDQPQLEGAHGVHDATVLILNSRPLRGWKEHLVHNVVEGALGVGTKLRLPARQSIKGKKGRRLRVQKEHI